MKKANEVNVLEEEMKEGFLKEIKEVLGKEDEKNIRKLWDIDGPMSWEEMLTIKSHLRIFKFQKEKEIK